MAKPGTIDVTHTDGPQKGETLQGIYALEGDTLKLCFSICFPTEFSSKPGAGGLLLVASNARSRRRRGEGPRISFRR